MTKAVLLDFVLPVVLGLAIFGALTFVANTYILHPEFGPLGGDNGLVWAGSTAAVTATVRAQNISVTSPADGAIAYGVLALGASQNTITLGDTQTATNDGNVTENFNLTGVDTTNWTLATSAAGPNEYLHEFTINGGTSYVTLDQQAKTGRTNIGVNTSATFDFRITVPTSDSSNGATQNANITITAVAS